VLGTDGEKALVDAFKHELAPDMFHSCSQKC